jgi:hypothetical protein
MTMRCGCLRCQLEAARELLRAGKPRMAAVVLEQALRGTKHKATPPKPAPRAGKAEGRA